MNPDVVERKLESLARCVRRAEARLPVDASTLSADYDTQDIIVVNLERAVQVCVDIATHLLADQDEPMPDTMSALFRSLAELGIVDPGLAESLSRAVGLRNLAIHEYTELDWRELCSYLPRGLDDFRRFAAAISAQTAR